jgi:Zn-dependent protease with chaperone function
MNFFEHQHQARRQTKLLVFYFVLAVMATLVLVNLAANIVACLSGIECHDFATYWLQPVSWIVTGVAVTIILLTSLIRWNQMKRGGGFKVIKMVGARAIDLNTQDLKERQLINIVEEISIAAGVPVPNIYVMEQETGINAFVAGTEPHNTCLVVTRGSLDKLTRQELQGVIGHEYSHIFNGDMRFNIHLIGILAGILVIGQLGEFFMQTRRSIRSKESKGDALVIFGLLLAVVGYFGLTMGRIIKAAISRQREYLADASAVQYTRDPEGIASALYKIKLDSMGSLLNTQMAEELSHMCFERSHRLPFFLSLLSTHPPIDERIAKIAPHFVPPHTQFEESTTDHTKANFHNSHTFGTSSFFSGAEIHSQSITEHIGQINAEHLDLTQWQLSLLPESLKAIARNTDKNYNTCDLVYAMLVLHNTLSRESILNASQKWLPEDVLERVFHLLPELSKLSTEQQMLLLDLALPRLKNYSKEQRTTLLNRAKQLVDYDRQVSLEEYVIYALLLLSLTEQKPFSKSITHFESVIPELSLVIGTFVAHTAASDEKKQKVFDQIMRGFGIIPAKIDLPNFDPNRFHKALRRLSCLSPLLKKPLIEALAEAIQSDGKLSAKEFMLLRAVCEYLDCPIPKLL